MLANLVFRRKIWGVRDNGIPPRSTPGDTGQVSVRYLGSEFLGHATAADLLTHFKDGIRQLDPKQLLQVSMDGPSVDWKFYIDLAREHETQELPELLNIGS